ncbi:MAG: hypothetical protein ACOCXH_11295 [Cyclobacteriaceae bacterium]
MKTLKTTIIITTGIITAILALLSVPVKAEKIEKAADLKESKAAIIDHQKLLETEQALLEDYFCNNEIPEFAIEESNVKIYNTEGQLVYEEQENESADMIKLSLFLVEIAGEKIYTLP